MGAVYVAEHRVMERAVALKVINRALTARPAVVERFRREVRAAARLSHPNIVTTYDAEDAGDGLFLVMEYVEGVNLGRLVKDAAPCRWPRPATTPARRLWAFSTPTSAAWSTATSSPRT